MKTILQKQKRQLGDVTVYKDVNFTEKVLNILQKLAISYSETLKIKGESQKKN